MKKIIFLAGSILYSVMSFAQEIHNDAVPSVVLNSFKQQFPKATDVEWELKNELYEVEFEIARKDHTAWINSAGNFIKHKQDITSTDLPKEVTASINKNYKGYRIDDVEKIEAGKKFSYKVELKTMSKEVNVVYDSSGKVIENYID